MSNKTRLSRLAELIQAQSQADQARDFGRRFMAAWQDGMILCRDGKTRPLAEWRENLPADVKKSLESIGLSS
jgi:hypothetical protein